MTNDRLKLARELITRESGLAVVVTLREDGSAHASVVNAGLLNHPVTGEVVAGFAVRGARTKLVNLRARPQATLVFRSGWDWVAVEGRAELVGPDDALPAFDPENLTVLLQTIYAAAVGGSPDDWAAMHDTMVEERHTAVLVEIQRVLSNA
jgi:PPOX class probable F420-dependent enzyme